MVKICIYYSMSSEKQIILDSFLSAYFITVIIASLGCNLTILVAIRKLMEQHQAFYFGLIMMCILALLASSILLPSVLVVVADPSVVSSGSENNLYFCQFLGGLSSFLHRASTFSFCLAYVDRYVIIRKPMAYTSLHRLVFSICCIIASILAIFFAVIPIFTTANNTTTYVRPTNIPFCIFAPQNRAGQNVVLVDTICSYVIAWSILAYTVIGILAIACFVGRAGPKIAPIESKRFVSGQLTKCKQLPEAWCDKPIKTFNNKNGGEIFNQTQTIKLVSPKIKTKSIKMIEMGQNSNAYNEVANSSSQSQNVTTTITSQTNLDDISDVSEIEGEDVNRESTITNVIFNDEVTLRHDGTAHWRSSTVAAVSSNCLPLAVERELTLEEMDVKKQPGARKICLSSFVDDQTSDAHRLEFRRSVRKKIAKFRTQTQMRVVQNKQNASRRFNTKAFLNLTVTLCLFTFLVFPVATLQFFLAFSENNPLEINIFWLETLISISFSSIYVAYPVMTAFADKEIKRTIVTMLRRVCDDHDAMADDVNESHAFGETRM